jgi:hypothetical protein
MEFSRGPEVAAPESPSLNEDLGIGSGMDLNSVGGQLLFELEIIIDLPVKDQDAGTVPAHERLMPAGRWIDDGVTGMRERGIVHRKRIRQALRGPSHGRMGPAGGKDALFLARPVDQADPLIVRPALTDPVEQPGDNGAVPGRAFFENVTGDPAHV